ncbi:NAD-dependent epimerase/dehydratase family protein [Shewanella chilikensis]|uniref:NAD-dependent epimerase/dehydratase family protein n=1 Tax=Shewanella chilikensis TaxID=558541 RepID=UPI001F27C17D|nr:NAD-dependent epimerase/dehydratase family protein [Shewanella chilikensis]MCE9852579.1 NAD-dependent epimerase/dehydratase family protein [Shewanella chilikensis]
MTILLTGASGFVGSYVLKNDDYDIRCVVRKKKPNKFKSTFEVTNIDGETIWDGAFSQVDTVIHLAGLAHSKSLPSEAYQKVNVDGTLNLALQAANAGVKRFVFVSSIGVNGISTQNKAFKFDSPEMPHNAYARSKYDAEVGLKKIALDTGLEIVIVRPTLVYGPDAPGNFGMLVRFVRKMLFLPFGLARNKRDFIAVQNLANLLLTCATHDKAPGHIFLASDGYAVSIKDFTNAVAKGLDKKIIQLPFPVFLMRLVGRLIRKSTIIEQLFGNLEVDSSNIKKVLGWSPPLTMEQAMSSLRFSDK